MLERKSIDRLISGSEIDSELKQQLQLVVEIRRYSVEQLALPSNGSYSSYVDLNRDFPVWTVVAAEEFSIDAMSWCYPMIGCANYRGYFSESDAVHYSNSLREKGFETTIGGTPAYSTLGWFDDPILPSMLRYGTTNLVESIFHELAHQHLYVKGDTSFNEAFATVVGEQGTILWLNDNRPELLEDYQQLLIARNDFGELLGGVKVQLEELYRSGLNQDEKRSKKSQIFNSLKNNYYNLKESKWQNLPWFDRWFEQKINNARLAAFSTYRDQVPKILDILRKSNFDFGQFYENIQTKLMDCEVDSEKLSVKVFASSCG